MEALAVMAKYNPFFEKAGMKKVVEHKPSKKITEIINQLLKIGFNLEKMSSKNYNLKKLKTLSKGKLKEIRTVLSSYPHPRLVRQLSSKSMFMNKSSWQKILENASLEKLASLIRLVSLLSQTKVYLFWSANQS